MLSARFRAITLFMAGLPLASAATPLAQPNAASVAVILDLQGRVPAKTLEEMKRQADLTLKDAGFRLDWRTRSEAARESFEDLVLVTIKGNCDVRSAATAPNHRVSLAQTFITDYRVQPFANLSCDAIAAVARSAMNRKSLRNSDALMGRAMARVLAHELIHMLTRSADHGTAGVARESLSGSELIQEQLAVADDDLERLQRGLGER